MGNSFPTPTSNPSEIETKPAPGQRWLGASFCCDSKVAGQAGLIKVPLSAPISNRKLMFQKIGKRVLIHHKELVAFAAKNRHSPVMDAS